MTKEIGKLPKNPYDAEYGVIMKEHKNSKGVIWCSVAIPSKGNRFLPVTKLFRKDELEPIGALEWVILKEEIGERISIGGPSLTHHTELERNPNDYSPQLFLDPLGKGPLTYRDLSTGEEFQMQ
ncbi:MAG: hypothetical protein ABIB79_01875 [archaeon]